jgi:hypothetical protein
VNDPTWTEPCDSAQPDTQPVTVDLDILGQGLTALEIHTMTTIQPAGEIL